MKMGFYSIQKKCKKTRGLQSNRLGIFRGHELVRQDCITSSSVSAAHIHTLCKKSFLVFTIHNDFGLMKKGTKLKNWLMHLVRPHCIGRMESVGGTGAPESRSLLQGFFYIFAIIMVAAHLKATLRMTPTYLPHERSFTLTFTIFA